MNLETKITIYKFTPQLFTLTPFSLYYSQKQDFHSNVLELSYLLFTFVGKQLLI